MDMGYTLHGMERSKERLNLNTKNAARQMELALERGIRAADCSSTLERRFLADRCLDDSEAIAYNGCCFIVNTQTKTVITVYPLPAWWGKRKRYVGKERVRKARAYYRMNDEYDYAM